MLNDLVTTVMIFSIPIIVLVTRHIQHQSKFKHQMIKDELELEKVKQQNYIMETEKMRLELEKEQAKLSKSHIK